MYPRPRSRYLGSPGSKRLRSKNREIQLVINTPLGRRGKSDSAAIRREALARQVPTFTTIPGAAAAVTGLESLARGELKVLSLQEYHAGKTF